MKKTPPLPDNPLIDDVRKTRQRLVEEHGGLQGWLDHLRELQQQHPGKVLPHGKHGTQ